MFQSTFMAQKKIKDHLESQKSSGKKKKKTVSHKFSGDSEQHTDLAPPLGSWPHFQFGQFLGPIEIIVSFRMIKNNKTSGYDFRSILNADFARGDSVHLLLFKWLLPVASVNWS